MTSVAITKSQEVEAGVTNLKTWSPAMNAATLTRAVELLKNTSISLSQEDLCSSLRSEVDLLRNLVEGRKAVLQSLEKARENFVSLDQVAHNIEDSACMALAFLVCKLVYNEEVESAYLRGTVNSQSKALELLSAELGKAIERAKTAEAVIQAMVDERLAQDKAKEFARLAEIDRAEKQMSYEELKRSMLQAAHQRHFGGAGGTGGLLTTSGTGAGGGGQSYSLGGLGTLAVPVDPLGLPNRNADLQKVRDWYFEDLKNLYDQSANLSEDRAEDKPGGS